MRSIVDVLYKICLERNVKFHLNSKVDKINLKNNKVTGVEVDGKSHNSDLVISNVDIHFVYKNLLDVKRKPIRILKQERSSSALIFYWGISKIFKSLDLHNILFSSDYRNEFDQIFKEKQYLMTLQFTLILHLSIKKMMLQRAVRIGSL